MNCYGRIMFLSNWLPVYDYIERYVLRHSWSSFHLWKCFCWMSFNAKCAWMDVIINFCSHQCNNFSIFNNWIMYSTQKKGIISLTGVWKKALSIFFLLCLSSIIRILHLPSQHWRKIVLSLDYYYFLQDQLSNLTSGFPCLYNLESQGF